MKDKIALLVLSVLTALVLSAVPVPAQDTEKAVLDQTVGAGEQVSRFMASEELSIYGEVQSVDSRGAGSMTIQYYDYDTDDEKTITIALDSNTKLENAGSIAGIKKGDWADVAYLTSGGINKAISVIVEKEEDADTLAAAEQAVTAGEVAVSGDQPY